MLGSILYAAGGGGVIMGAYQTDECTERYEVAFDNWIAARDGMLNLKGRDSFSAVNVGCTGPAEEEDFFDTLK